METAQLLFWLIRVAVCGEAPAQELKTACTPEALEQVFAMATRHDLAHLAGQGASKLQLADSEPLQKCKKAAMQAFMRHARQEYTYQKVCALLEQAQIPFIPLKGSVLRAHYPEGWMRTSCDMDILVHEEALEQASALLEQNGWTFREKTSHDLAFSSADGVHLELHYSTIEDYVSEAGKKIMEGIWDDAAPLPGKQYHMVISDPLFYYYHMAHMAKHFVHGGCGIRTFLDIWILNHRMEFNPEARNALLEEGKLSAFARGAEALAEGRDIREDALLSGHAAWAEELKKTHTFTHDNAMDILMEETGRVFAGVLEDAGVYKRTAEGREAFLRFVARVNQ